MAKFSGPAHVSSIVLSSGPLAVVDGVAEVHEPTQGDIAGLAANGFSLVAEGAYFATPEVEAPAPEADPAQQRIVEPEAAAEADHPVE